MSDGKVHFPYPLVQGDDAAREFSRGTYESGLAAANQYEQGDLVFVNASGNVRKARASAAGSDGAVGSGMPRVLLAGQDYDIPEQELPPGDGTSPHWVMRERGVPLNHLRDGEELVFTLRGGSGAAAADDTDYDLTATDITDIKAGVSCELFYDATHKCYVVDLSTKASSDPNVRITGFAEREEEAGETNIKVRARILSDFIA